MIDVVVTLVADTFNVNNNGITVSAMRFASHLLNHGHTVRVVATGDSTQSGYDELTGLTMYYVPELKIPLATQLAHKQNTLFGKPVKTTLFQAISGSDVVHLYQPWPLEARAARIAKQLGVPVIAAFHIQPENITYNIGLKGFAPAVTCAYWVMYLLFYRKFRDIHCPSRFIAAQLRAHGYKARLHVISNGVLPDFCPDTNVHQFQDGLFHILMVGRLSPEKRQDLLILATLQSKYADKIQLHFAGSGPKSDYYKKLGEQLPIAPIFGYYKKDDLIDLMRSCNLYVHASDVEIEGMGCMEAFSCGLVPIISDSKQSATGQYALTAESLFKAGDASSLSKRIDFWIEHPQELEDRKELYVQMAKQLSVERSVKKIEKVYASLPQKKTVPYYHGRLFRFFSRALTIFATPFLFFLTRFTMGVHYTGRKNLKGIKGAITFCSHAYPLGCALVNVSLFPKKVIFPMHTVANESGFQQLASLMGGVPAPQCISDFNDFFCEMELQLEKGKIVHFSPRETYDSVASEPETHIKSACHLASQMRLPLIPIKITYKAPRGLYKILKKPPVPQLSIGLPIFPICPDVAEDKKTRLKLALEQI